MTAPAPQLLGGTDNAAIMVMLLAEEDASRILSQLTPDELRQLAGTMCGIGEIEPQAIADAIAGFSRSTENSGISGHGRVDNNIVNVENNFCDLFSNLKNLAFWS